MEATWGLSKAPGREEMSNGGREDMDDQEQMLMSGSGQNAVGRGCNGAISTCSISLRAKPFFFPASLFASLDSGRLPSAVAHRTGVDAVACESVAVVFISPASLFRFR